MTDRPDSPASAPPTVRSTAGRRWPRIVAAVLLLSGVAAVWAGFGERLHLGRLVGYETQLRDAVEQRPVVVFAAAFAIYVVYVGLSLPGASILTPLVGWLFGFWKGVLFASFAATAGATLAFLLSRYLLRDFVQHRWADRLQTVNAALEQDGPYYLLTLRLVPAFPFFVINLVLGLTKMPVRTYWWVSQLGMAPGTCVFVYAGTTIPTLAELASSSRSILNWRLAAALTALGLLPLGLRYLLKLVGRQSPTEGPSEKS